MINVSELITDSDFAQSFSITRVTAAIVQAGPGAGELAATHPAPIPTTGVVITDVSPEALLVLPEGLRSSRAIMVFTTIPLHTGGDEDPITDYVNYGPDVWKVAHLSPYGDFGFWQAIAIQSNRAAFGTLV